MNRLIKNGFSQTFVLIGMFLVVLCLPLATNLVKQSQDDRSRAEESSSSQISFKISFTGVKPSSSCLSSLSQVKVELANKPTNVSQSEIKALITPVSNETNAQGDQVFLVSHLVLDSKFNNVNNFNYLRVKGPSHLASRMCLNNQTTKLDEITTCEINLTNTNTTTYNFSNYSLTPGDINQDGIINSSDYSIIKNNFNSNTINCNQTGDLNYDGIVNSLDASLLKESLSRQEEGEIGSQVTTIITPTKTPTPTGTVIPTETPDSALYSPIIPSSYNKRGLSDTLKVWWLKKSNYDLVYVWAKEPYKQLHTYSSSNYGKKYDKMANIMNNALKKVIDPAKITMAWNLCASTYYGNGVGANEFSSYINDGLIIQEGVILREDYTSNKTRMSFVGIDNQNNLNYYKDSKSLDINTRKANYEAAKNSGTLNTLEIFPGGVLLKDGKINNTSTTTNSYQGFCQVNKNNFVYVVTEEDNRSSISLKSLANILKNLGCKDGFRLDGGGSTTLWFKPANASKWTKLRGDGSRHLMWNIFYWTEL